MRTFEKIGNEDAINTLSRFIVETRYEDLPPEVIEFAKQLIFDTIGCMVGGHCKHPIPIIAKHIRDKGGKPESYIPFFGGKVPAEEAAMTMGPMTRAIDFAPIHAEAMHQTEHVLPAMLGALGMKKNVTGKEFILAFVVGVETLLRIGIGYNGNRGIEIGRSNGHYIFGSVGAVGKMMGLDQETLENAFGIARQMTQPHDMAAYHPVTHMIKVHQGFIAQDAVNCVKFAMLGVTGPRVDVIEGPKGLLGMAAWQTFPEKICADLGKYWNFMDIEMKAYCGCKCLHMACCGTTELMKEHHLKPDDIAHVHVRECKLNSGVSGGTLEEKLHPHDIYERQFSIPYMVSTMILDGDLMPNSFTDEAAARPFIQEFMKKVDFSRDDSLPAWYSEVTITTTDGKKYVIMATPEMLKGSHSNRYSTEETIAKFKKCVPYSVFPMPDALVDKIINNVLYNLDKSQDVMEDVLKLITPLD